MFPLIIASLFMQGVGALEKAEGAREQQSAQQGMIGVEQQENQLRRQMMHLSAQRENMQILRNVQRARSLALANVTNSGAQFGSALGGGYGQIAGASNTNRLKISQDVAAGDQMFDFQQRMLQFKQQYARAGGDINAGQGLMSLGAAVGGSAGQISSLGKEVGAGMSSFFNPQPFASSGYYGKGQYAGEEY